MPRISTRGVSAAAIAVARGSVFDTVDGPVADGGWPLPLKIAAPVAIAASTSNAAIAGRRAASEVREWLESR